jgi:hypothetical protein
VSMDTPRKKPLLAVGDEEEWARINELAVEVDVGGRRLRLPPYARWSASSVWLTADKIASTWKTWNGVNGELPIEPIPGLDT